MNNQKTELRACIVSDICEMFEDFLDERDITIPNENREGNASEARIYADDWDDIIGRVADIIDSYIVLGNLRLITAEDTTENAKKKGE